MAGEHFGRDSFQEEPLHYITESERNRLRADSAALAKVTKERDEARANAIEECAKLCEERMRRWGEEADRTPTDDVVRGRHRTRERAVRDVLIRIRALGPLLAATARGEEQRES